VERAATGLGYAGLGVMVARLCEGLGEGLEGAGLGVREGLGEAL
jgi:hypothetical protein